MRKADLVAAGLCLLTAVVVIYQSLPNRLDGRGSLGPGAYPIFVSVVLLLCGASVLYQWFTGKRETGPGEPVASWDGRKRLVYSVGSFFAYQLIIGFLGFALSSFLLMAFQMRALGTHRWWTTFLISAVFAAAVGYCFSAWLHLPLPGGLLGL
jgi:hypothetical protein